MIYIAASDTDKRPRDANSCYFIHIHIVHDCNLLVFTVLLGRGKQVVHVSIAAYFFFITFFLFSFEGYVFLVNLSPFYHLTFWRRILFQILAHPVFKM